MTRKKRWVWMIAFVLVGLALLPSYVRAYRVGGPSDAPTYLLGELFFVNWAAYDIRLPYTDVSLIAHSDPERGDVVMYRVPGEEPWIFKRIVGCPGDVIEMRDNRLTINGAALEYERLDPAPYSQLAESNKLGSIIEIEAGNGPAHTISHDAAGGTYSSFGPVAVPEGHYFLIGDNRDNSRDSREYGPVPREYILGRLSRPYRSGSP
jgi:signal peptidase I